jgi:hypothetical protein
MAPQRSHSIEFKRQVAQEFIAGESLYRLSKRHGTCGFFGAFSVPVAVPARCSAGRHGGSDALLADRAADSKAPSAWMDGTAAHNGDSPAMARAWTCVTLTRARLARKRHADATPPVRPIDPAKRGGPKTGDARA